MLSGIGPRGDARAARDRRARGSPGVGQNLQDRYEVAVVNRMKFDAWKSLRGATFTRDDAQYREWANEREGVYDTQRRACSRSSRGRARTRSRQTCSCYALVGRVPRILPGYSSELAKNPNCFTWVVLKAHTNNTAGEVTLRSADPRVPPLINFRYFDEGNDKARRGTDLAAVAAGVALARRLTADASREGASSRQEELPGDAVPDAKLPEFVRDNAWGHHASCTCRIGARKDGGVVSSDFKVHGVERLRVVDAVGRSRGSQATSSRARST